MTQQDLPKRTMDLTGDRPLPLEEARLLARWWNDHTAWVAKLIPAHGKFFHVRATHAYETTEVTHA